jgi:fructosamine-3-kinase
MQQVYRQQKCSAEDLKSAEKICSKFDSLFPPEPPALLHGDLWSGNFVANKNGDPVIYDPAVYYGHREMDIAMTLLFGGFDSSFYHYYNEAYPLPYLWKERIKLCQLYPLLVHLALFGGNYYGSVKNIITLYDK